MNRVAPITAGFNYELVAEDYQATLMEIAERIRGRYRNARRDILEIGRDLLATKAELDHGLFLGWIEAEFKWSERTAQSYMQAAREWGEVQNRDAVADLPVKLLYDLSANTNADIKAEVIADLDSGKPVDVPAVMAKIKRAKKEASLSGSSQAAEQGARMTELRPYQQQVVANTREALQSCTSVILPIPTGGGKTVVGADLIRQEVEAGGYVVVLVHRTELVDQTVGKLFDIGIDAGIIKAGYKPRPNQRVQVCSVQTLHARAVRRQSIEMPKATLVVVDECHHARARTWREILEALPDAKIIGLSATPARSDGRGLGSIFHRIIEAPQTADLIALGYLVPTKVYAPHDPDLKGVQTKAGDYVESQLAERMDKAELTGDIVEHWLRHANRQPTIAFCCNVAHSKHICDQFRLAGVLAEHIDASTPPDERKAILSKLARAEIEVVTNCGILTEGFDAPNVGCVIMARPTRSTVLFRQMIGRGLRTAPGKSHCLVLDHSGAVFRHGFAEDRVEWTLHEDRRAEVPAQARRTARHETSLCTCPECSAVRMQGQPCTACGWRPQPKAQAVEVADGDLQQVDRARRTLPSNWTADTKEQFYRQLLFIASERGYQSGWASHKYREKFGSWPAKKFLPPLAPDQAVRSWVKSRQIAYARSQAHRGAA